MKLKVFDTDGDGFISPFELGQALASMGESRTVEDLQEMIRGADVNGDGQVRVVLCPGFELARPVAGLSRQLRISHTASSLYIAPLMSLIGFFFRWRMHLHEH